MTYAGLPSGDEHRFHISNTALSQKAPIEPRNRYALTEITPEGSAGSHSSAKGSAVHAQVKHF